MNEVLKKTAAVTGVIGSGKSTFCSYLQELGAGVVSADALAHEVLEDSDIRSQISKRFNLPGTFTRQELAKEAFSDKQSLQALNSITHPAIRRKAEQELKRLGLNHDLLVYDVPLFFEAGLNELPFLCSILVCAKKETLIERVLNRDASLTREMVLKRLNSQISLDEKRHLADLIIENDGTKNELQKLAADAYKKLTLKD